MVRDAINEAEEPRTVADATMNQPFGKPYTKPEIVTAVEYPIIGGKAHINVIIQRIVHPPRTSCHFFAAGASQPNIRSL